MNVSCIVPVYNNSKTIRHVLSILYDNDNIDEIVVIDDASRDNSREIIEEFLKGKDKIVFLKNDKNLGKGGAVVKALRQSKYDDVFLCDADLSTLKHEHVNAIVETYATGQYDMVIATRETPFEEEWQPFNKFLATVSGERILKKSVIEPYYDLISGLGNGIEQITNFAHRDKEVKLITSVGIGHIMKYSRGNPLEWTKEYVQEGIQLVKTDIKLKKKVVPTVAVTALAGILLSFWFFKTRHNRKQSRKLIRSRDN